MVNDIGKATYQGWHRRWDEKNDNVCGVLWIEEWDSYGGATYYLFREGIGLDGIVRFGIGDLDGIWFC